jgi:DNA-binding LacI/PurR family transcriptional regulator
MSDTMSSPSPSAVVGGGPGGTLTEAEARALLEEHVAATGSERGAQILANFESEVGRFWQIVPPAEADRAEGGEAIHALLPHAKRRDFPTAFVTYNTPMAYGAALALQREGWNVPADLSLASADVSRLSIEGVLRITGAGTSPDKLGETAARLVLGENMPDEGYTDLILPGPLVIGNSTGPARK